jgi:hypothetical protein
MNISRFGKGFVAFAAGVGVVLGVGKDIFHVAEHLNGWHVLAFICAAVLFVLAFDSIRIWLRDEFKKQEKLTNDLKTIIVEKDADLRGRIGELERKMLILAPVLQQIEKKQAS